MPTNLTGMGLDSNPVPMKKKRSIFDQMNSAKAKFRDGLVEPILAKYGGPDPKKVKDAAAHGFHEDTMEFFTETMAPYLGETATRGLLTSGGNLNESISGVLSALSGTLGGTDEHGYPKSFVGTQGADIGDLMANERGFDKGFENHRKKPQNVFGKLARRAIGFPD